MHAGGGGGAVLAAAAVSAPLGWLLVGCQHTVVLVPHELQCRWPGRGGGGAVRPHRHKHSTHVLCMYIGGTETDSPVGSRDSSLICLAVHGLLFALGTQ